MSEGMATVRNVVLVARREYAERVGSRAFKVRFEMFLNRLEVVVFVFDKQNYRFCHALLIQETGRL